MACDRKPVLGRADGAPGLRCRHHRSPAWPRRLPGGGRDACGDLDHARGSDGAGAVERANPHGKTPGRGRLRCHLPDDQLEGGSGGAGRCLPLSAARRAQLRPQPRASLWRHYYWQYANDEVLVFAMVETREAVKNLDEIVSVEGLDGVYVGPSDLSLSMGKTPTLDPQDPEVLAAIKAICAGTRKRGKIAGVHTD